MANLALPNGLLLLAESKWLFSESDLLHTPSVIAGLSPTQERENRAKGVNFILQAGIMLKLPQITIATASIFLHRFFMRHSMIEDKVTGRQHQHYYSIAATCLFLATKVEENCRKMKDLVVACVRVAQKSPNKEVDEQDKEFWRWRDTILQLEDLLLEALCFDLSLESPYKILYDLLLHFHEENNKPLRNAAWTFVNDSCSAPLCVLYSSRTIAASAIYAAARHCQVRLMDDEQGRPWWEVAGIDLGSMRQACNYMASVYENVPSRQGSDDTNIHHHTPDGSEDRFAKTREPRPGVPEPPRDPTGPFNAANKMLTSRTPAGAGGSGGHSPTASDVSRKRARDNDDGDGDEEEGEIARGGSSPLEGGGKRRRTEEPADANGTGASAARGTGTGTGTTNGTHAPASNGTAKADQNGTRNGHSGADASPANGRKVDVAPPTRREDPDTMGDDDAGNGSEEGEL